MWIEELKSGGFAFRETYKDPLTGKHKKVSVTMPNKSRTSQRAAVEELQERIRKLTGAISGEIDVYELIEKFMASTAASIKPATARNREGYVRTLQKYIPEGAQVCRITPLFLQQTVDKIAADVSPSRAAAVFRLLSQAYRYGARVGLLSDDSVVSRVIIPTRPKTRSQVEKEQSKYLSRDELREVLDMIPNKRMALILEFQALTGLRFGELAALRDEDYDAEKREIDVNATLVPRYQKGDKPTRGTPKNAFSYRKVLLDERATKLLEGFMATNKQRRLWNPSEHDAAGDTYIFTNRDGGPLDISIFNRVLRKLNYTKPLSTHVFRHTHISLLAESGVPLKAIMDRVGHNEPRTTLSVYTHATQQMREQVVEVLERVSK